MSDYSDLIFLIGALVIYGLLVTDANRAMLINNQKLTNSEVEYGAISAGQDVIDHTRWIKYDDISKSKLENYFQNNVKSGSLYDMNVSFSQPDEGCPTSAPCKKVDVEITSKFLNHSVTMSLIKTKFLHE